MSDEQQKGDSASDLTSESIQNYGEFMKEQNDKQAEVRQQVYDYIDAGKQGGGKTLYAPEGRYQVGSQNVAYRYARESHTSRHSGRQHSRQRGRGYHGVTVRPSIPNQPDSIQGGGGFQEGWFKRGWIRLFGSWPWG